MSGLRAAREAAYWAHWRKSLRENPRDGLPAFLDELERLDREFAPIVLRMDSPGPAIPYEPTLIPERIEQPAPADVPPPDPDEPKPVRRRATRRAGGNA